MKDSNTILYAGDTNDPNNWLSGFLSLGIPASIAIAVSTIVIFTLGIGGVICCCHRCCRINQGYNNHYSDDRIQRRSGAFLSDAGNSSYNYSRSQHRGIVAVNTGAQLSGNLNLVSHVDSNQQNINREWQQSAHFPPESVAVGENYSQRGYNVPTHYQQAFNHYFTSQHTNNEKEIQSHCILQTPLKLSLMDRPYPIMSPSNETMGSQYFVSVGHHGSDSYSSINTNSARGFDQSQNRPPGPPPALIHGALGSPYTYRRGEMYRPLSPQNSSIFQSENRGHSSVTTTGSGSSRDRQSHQYFLNEIQSHHSECQAFVQRTHQPSLHNSVQNNSRRSKISSHRHHHRLKHHKSTDPNRTISSGSHTPNSSRSGALSVLPHRTGDVHEQIINQSSLSTTTTIPSTTAPSNHQPIIFPVQL
ncbi:unnamed protein product [Trichobilharzia regenti]|nr:unnamed protein product [Trichobilharzia regenti]